MHATAQFRVNPPHPGNGGMDRHSLRPLPIDSARVEALLPSPSSAVAGEEVSERRREGPATQRPGERTGFTRQGAPNGLTHGLTSGQVVIACEDPAAYDAYRAHLLADLQPVGSREEDLAEMMAMAEWRLRRLWRQERGVYDRWQHWKLHTDPDGTDAVTDDSRHEQVFPQLTRHEAHLTRTYLRAEARLRQLQDLRRKGLGRDRDAAKDVGGPESARSSTPQPIHAQGADSTFVAASVEAHRDAPSAVERQLPQSPMASAQAAVTTDDPEPPPTPVASAHEVEIAPSVQAVEAAVGGPGLRSRHEALAPTSEAGAEREGPSPLTNPPRDCSDGGSGEIADLSRMDVPHCATGHGERRARQPLASD